MVDKQASFWTEFMPHGHCYLWRADILWLNVVSDVLIALAYFAISITFYLVLRKRSDTTHRNLVILFSLFIFACGVTHLIAIWTTWHGNYGLQGISKAVTATISIITAAILVPAIPKLVELKSSDDLQALNNELRKQIEDQRNATEKLARTEDKLRIYLREAPDGIILVRATGIIEYSNEMANSMFGYPSDGLTGEYVTALMPNHSRDNIFPGKHDVFDEEFARSKYGVAEFIGIRKDTASEFPVEVSIKPIHSEADYGELVLATLRNISDRRKREEQERRELADLAHESRLSTVGSMASGLAHELNQPLTAISNNLHTAMSILSSKANPDQTLLQMIRENYESTQRAGQIIKSLRSLVSKGSGEKQSNSINELAQTISRLVAPEAKSANVMISLELDEDLPDTVFDAIQIQQVAINLYRNAIESLASSDVKQRQVTIATSRKGEDSILFSVKDNGPGLSAEARSNLFLPYFTSKKSGMGLGLSICQSIIESHGGLLWLDKTNTNGALFHFTIPMEGPLE